MKISTIIMLTLLETTLAFGQNQPTCSNFLVENLAMENDSIMKITIRNNCTSCGSNGGYADIFIIQNSLDTIARTNCFCLFGPAGASNPQTYYIPSNVATVPPINQLRVSMMFDVCDSIPFSPTLAINENNKKTQIKIYPNPAKQKLTIELNDPTTSIEQIIITDINGKEVKKIKCMQKNKMEVDTTFLKQGTYVIVVTTNRQTITKKIVIE